MEDGIMMAGCRIALRRNFIKGVIAAGAAVSSASYLFRANASGQATSAPGSVERLILTVGQRPGSPGRRDEERPWRRRCATSSTDRHQAGMHRGMRRVHGADDDAALRLLGADALGVHEEDRTIEGLASVEGTLHPVQQGVVDEQGFQCAFCMPGPMSAVGYLKTNPNPTQRTGARCLGTSAARPRQNSHRADEGR